MEKILVSALVLTLTSNLSYAAPRTTKKESIRYLSQTIKKEDTKIKGLKKQIIKLEKDLGSKNEKLLSLIEKKRSIQAVLMEVKSNLAVMERNLTQERDGLLSHLRRKVLSELNENQQVDELIERRVVDTAVSQKLALYQNKINEIKKIQKSANAESAKLYEFEKKESVLLDLLSDLEKEKQDSVSSYLKHDQYRQELQKKLTRLEQIEVKKKAKFKGGFKKFSLPVSNYVKMKRKNKGVLFYGKDTMPVQSPLNGKIVYTGKLSTYGNVIMIDHGKDTRSILLGNISSKVKKGTRVSKGQVIGYTMKEDGPKSELYFEVRKRNEVLNTFALLDLPKNKRDKNYALKRK